MLMRVTYEGIHSSINIRYFELNDIPYSNDTINCSLNQHGERIIEIVLPK